MPQLPRLQLNKPGLFITGTDTDVGKTVVSCAIAQAWAKRLPGRLGVAKPLASDCTWEDGEWVNADALSLQRAAGGHSPLGDINPVRFELPLAPAVAAEAAGQAVDWQAVADGLMRLDAANDALLVEGVGGLLVPLDPRDAGLTCVQLIQWIGYPVVVVARSVLGTLNHAAMTVTLLKQAGCNVVGVVMNGFDLGLAQNDPSIQTNQDWIERMTGVPVLAVVPKAAETLDLVNGPIDPAIADAVTEVDWSAIASVI